MFCDKCGSLLTWDNKCEKCNIQYVYKQENGQEDDVSAFSVQNQNTIQDNKNVKGVPDFFSTSVGGLVIKLAFVLLFYGLEYLLMVSGYTSTPLFFFFAIPGWIIITRIFGWVIIFGDGALPYMLVILLVKLVASFIVGFVTTPFFLGMWLGRFIASFFEKA